MIPYLAPRHARARGRQQNRPNRGLRFLPFYTRPFASADLANRLPFPGKCPPFERDEFKARMRLSMNAVLLHSAATFIPSGIRPKPHILTSPHDSPFSLSFTAASLRPDLLRIVAEAYLNTGNWDEAKALVLSNNLLQSRSPASARRMESELRHRLIHLTPAQIQLAANGMTDERTAIAWLAAMKGSHFIYAFASEVLRTKLALLDPVLRASDYEAFLVNQSAAHPAVSALTQSSKTKIRSVLFSMVREAGIGTPAGREFKVQRPVIPPSVNLAIRADSPVWLAGFLVPDDEFNRN